MRRLWFYALLIAPLLCTLPASAQWSTGTAAATVRADYDQTFTYTFSDTGDSSTNQDVSACTSPKVTLSNASAQVALYDCYAVDSTRGADCVRVHDMPDNGDLGPTPVAFPRGFAKVRVTTAAGGGSVSIACSGVDRRLYSATDGAWINQPTSPAAKLYAAESYRVGSTTGGIQEAIDACGTYGGATPSSGGCIVQLPKGQVNVTSKIYIGRASGTDEGAYGLVLQGYGKGVGVHASSTPDDPNLGTVIVYNGTATQHGVINVRGCQNCTLRDFSVRTDSGNDGALDAEYTIYIAGDNAPDNIVDLTMERLFLTGRRQGDTSQGMYIGYCLDANSDSLCDDDTSVSTGGVGDNSSAGDRADGIHMRDIVFKDGGYGLIVDNPNTEGLTCDGCTFSDQRSAAVDVRDGYFTMSRGYYDYDSLDGDGVGTAINIRNAAKTVVIRDNYFLTDNEAGQTTIATEHANSSSIKASPLATNAATRNSLTVIEGNTFDCLAGGTCDVIDYRHAGNLTVRDNIYLDSGTSRLIFDNEVSATTLTLDRLNNNEANINTLTIDPDTVTGARKVTLTFYAESSSVYSATGTAKGRACAYITQPFRVDDIRGWCEGASCGEDLDAHARPAPNTIYSDAGTVCGSSDTIASVQGGATCGTDLTNRGVAMSGTAQYLCMVVEDATPTAIPIGMSITGSYY